MGLRWVFPFHERLQSDEGDVCENEREYFEERKKAFTVEFKKEPPRALTQAFEVNFSPFYTISCV